MNVETIALAETTVDTDGITFDGLIKTLKQSWVTIITESVHGVKVKAKQCLQTCQIKVPEIFYC